MQITEPTIEEVETWKRVFEDRAGSLQANRISGAELDSYFRNQYHAKLIENAELLEVFRYNLFEMIADYKEKYNKEPRIMMYLTNAHVYVGIDINSGFFSVESEPIELSVPIYDDLFLKRGLDEEDLQNCFLVYEYVNLKEKDKCNA